ncbi:MAG: D-alanine--D-alanine ligase [Candidatus Neomarinimicrobiota bacterium]|nr:D-alanine--D-alanine ligase [Candidatus Neomarinimicrobiota bacterium]
MKVVVLMGGNSAEREVSLNSGNAVVSALRLTSADVSGCIYEDKIEDYLEELVGADVVFLALHGGEGENGEVQRILEREGIVYTGSGPDASAVAMDKNASKKLMIENELPTPAWCFFHNSEEYDLSFADELGYPMIVKPNREGSTVGLSIVHSEANLKSAIEEADSCGGGVILEEYIPGRELTVGILGNISLPCIEIIPSHDHYDYECKYTSGMSDYICPADLPAALASQLSQTSLTMHQIVGCRHYSRVDFRLSPENSFYCLEVNTLPGLTDTSLVPKAAAVLEMSFTELILKLCRMALDDK